MDYCQPYYKQEYRAVRALCKKFNVPYQKVMLPAMECDNGVFKDRNFWLLDYFRDYRDDVTGIYLGIRNPISMLDRYKDSNKQFANFMQDYLGIKIYTPALMMPKCLIKYLVKRAGITEQEIFSTEGYKYE